MDAPSKPRSKLKVGCLAALGVFLVLLALLYRACTVGKRAASPARSSLHAGMTLGQVVHTLCGSNVWYGELRSTAQENHVQGSCNGAGRFEFLGWTQKTGSIPRAVFDDSGAKTLEKGLGDGEWNLNVRYIDFMTVYSFDVSFDANHRVKDISGIIEKAPHE